MNPWIIIWIIFIILAFMALIVYTDWSNRRNADKKVESEWINRDYGNIPNLGKCMRCGYEAFLTTSVLIPAVETKNGKLKYNKFDTRILYSVHCSKCSLCTEKREELSEVLTEWNESDLSRIRDNQNTNNFY